MSLLLQLNGLVEGQVTKRPSKFIKTPYVADVKCVQNDEEVLAHTAALGCCGLADVNASVLMTLSNSESKSKPKNKAGMKCGYTIYLSILREGEHCQIVGIQPKLAETLVENALNANLLSRLRNIRSYRRETVMYIEDKVDSRFDFSGIDENGIPFIMEVKNVPLADYEDVSAKERLTMDFTGRPYDSKVAYFPDGYRKKTTDTVSPRALKHINELTLIKTECSLKNNIRCIMCYVIQRTDVNRFQPSVIDPEYRAAFKTAVEAGVEVITLVVSWNMEGEAYFVRDDLPLSL
jgi:DNA-binding sugar fermentation-stimulating protein